ncbi:hypothetical protein ACQ858_19535 [Variovorax ureilyticus]|uniref:hypothetical protein n=1 Tax=Variovorax ureilyticus TaxID=1836198 RepID=UPI003D674AFF
MNSLLVTLAPAVLVAAASAIPAYFVGDSHGAARVQQAWDNTTANQAEHKTAQIVTTREKETTHAGTVTQAIDTYQAARAPAADDSAARIADAQRLQRAAEERAIRYRDLSKAGAAERDRLASHAAELDSSLAAGRIVAEQLRATVVERDQQLQLLGAIITADRALAEPGGGTNAIP